MAKISNAQHQLRLDNLQAKVAQHELDLFLVSSRDNIYYLTGIVCEPMERPMFLLVRPKGLPVFLVPTLERDHMDERTYFTARPSTEAQSVFASMMAARRIAMEKIRPGVSCSEVDTLVKEFLEKEGYGDNLLHRTGHGLGIAYHAEAPRLAEGSDERLTPGMVLSVEPGIYLPEVGGFRHSDTVVVTDDGCRCLTGSATGIDELTITAWKPYTRLKGRLVRRSLGVKPP